GRACTRAGRIADRSHGSPPRPPRAASPPASAPPSRRGGRGPASLGLPWYTAPDERAACPGVAIIIPAGWSLRRANASLPAETARWDDGSVRYVRLVLLAGGIMCLLAAPAFAQDQPSGSPTVVSLRLSGVVDPFEA